MKKLKTILSKNPKESIFMLSFLFAMLIVPECYLASEGAFMDKFKSFETLLTDIISILGTIYTLWAVAEWGLAFHESNGTMGGQSFKKIFGGLVVILSPQILAML